MSWVQTRTCTAEGAAASKTLGTLAAAGFFLLTFRTLQGGYHGNIMGISLEISDN